MQDDNMQVANCVVDYEVNTVSNLILPWYNFPLINFIQSYIKPQMNIFEFGTGISSIFYAHNGCNIYGVEANIEWLTKVQILAKEKNLSNRISIEFCKKSHEIASYLAKVPQNNGCDIEFDAIIIDSYNRIECLAEAKKFYKKGIIILDNSERENLKEAKKVMKNFDYLHFKGNGLNRDGESESLVFFLGQNLSQIGIFPVDGVFQNKVLTF